MGGVNEWRSQPPRRTIECDSGNSHRFPVGSHGLLKTKNFPPMFLAEPPTTQFDLHFQLAGIPVRIHPLFWLACVVTGSSGDGPMLLVWTVVVFVSVLIHEMGHAIMMRRCGMTPRVVLYMMGGLAIPDSGPFGMGRAGRRTPQNWILISGAGPVAGFAFAGLVILLIIATGGHFSFERGFPHFWSFDLREPVSHDNWLLYMALDSLLWVNIFWGLINLIPVYPLDGGQIAREFMVLRDPWHGIVRSMWLSVIVGGIAVAMGLSMQSMFVVIMFLSLAVSNYRALQQIQGGGFGGGNPW